jgi:hypothetical protein
VGSIFPDKLIAIRNWPWTLILTSAPNVSKDEHLFRVLFATNYSISNTDAKKTITSAVQNITTSNTFTPISTTGENYTIEFVAFVDHNSILWRQPRSELQAGIVQDLYALQGSHSTWYTGGLWSADYTGDVWAFTDTVLPKLLADLQSSGTK